MSSAKLRRHTRGAVFIEFLIAFVPLFLFFLGTTQLALIYASHLVVQHAAVLAVRAAVVTLDDDPCYHRGEARGTLPPKGSSGGSGVLQGILNLAGLGEATGGGVSAGEPEGGLKLQRVRNAAYLPLALLAPAPEQMAAMFPWVSSVVPGLDNGHSVQSALGNTQVLRIASGLAVYNRVATAITFPVAPGSKELRALSSTKFETNELVTVKVTYLLSCNVPVVREFMCESFLDMAGWTGLKKRIATMLRAPSIENARELGNEIFDTMPKKLRTAKQLAGEMRHAEWKALVPLLASSRNKFIALRSEATLPNQGAPYQYPSELEKRECEGMN